MSNLQDVPLPNPEGLPIADSEETQGSKTSSLKRFFKMNKKPTGNDDVENADETLDGDNKELGKSNTLSRFFTRKRGSNKDGQEQQSSSMAIPIAQEKPAANPKPTLKSSMSAYWKRLFHLQKNQNQAAGSEPEEPAVNGPEEVHELVQNDAENQADLEEPDLDPKEESLPQTISEPETKPQKDLAGEQLEAALKDDPKDDKSDQPASEAVSPYA